MMITINQTVESEKLKESIRIRNFVCYESCIKNLDYVCGIASTFLLNLIDNKLSDEDFNVEKENVLNAINSAIVKTKIYVKRDKEILTSNNLLTIKEKVTFLKNLSKKVNRSHHELTEEMGIMDRNVTSKKEAISSRIKDWEYRENYVWKAFNIMEKHPSNNSSYRDKVFLYAADYMIDSLNIFRDVESIRELINEVSKLGLKDEELENNYKKCLEYRELILSKREELESKFPDLADKYYYSLLESEEIKKLKNSTMQKKIIGVMSLNIFEVIGGAISLENIKVNYPEYYYYLFAGMLASMALINVLIYNQIDKILEKEEKSNSLIEEQYESAREEREKRIALRK